MNREIGFIKRHRKDIQYRPIEERINDYLEIEIPLSEESLTRHPGVFAAGDAVLRASLVAHAINSVMGAAERIDSY
jgi:NADPH-dependent glutamate synthase beta subunit-like oxidoreductase